MKSVRNIFDQYSQDENRLTHALACALASDPAALRSFLAHFVGIERAKKFGSIQVAEQVGHNLKKDPSGRKKSVPDLVIRNQDGRLGVAVECKVKAGTDHGQLQRHFRGLERQGFTHPKVLLISIDGLLEGAPNEFKSTQWRDVREWADTQKRKPDSFVAAFSRYMEVFEARTFEKGDGMSIAGFTGINFDEENPYTYSEAKVRLKALMEELKLHRPQLKKIGAAETWTGRKAIKGKASNSVWDFIPLGSAHAVFTARPHLTIVINDSMIAAQLTIPNNLDRGRRKKLRSLAYEDFQELVIGIGKSLQRVTRKFLGAYPFVEMLQRHYPSQQATPVRHAYIDFDIRTAYPKKKRKGEPDFQPQWLRASYEAYCEKKSNLQMALGVRFPYSKTGTGRKHLVQGILETWLRLGPMIKLLK